MTTPRKHEKTLVQKETLIRKILIEIAPIIISILSFFLSSVVLYTSSKQFQFLNQGYIDVTPGLGFVIKGNDKIKSLGGSDMDNEALIEGLNFSLEMKNVGNFPVSYRVESFNVFINNKKENVSIEGNDPASGILYPKQQRPFLIKTFKLNDGNGMLFKDLRKLEMRSSFRIRYSDLNSMRSKCCGRELVWDFHDNALNALYTRFDDEI